jgi:hypothetical protein
MIENKQFVKFVMLEFWTNELYKIEIICTTLSLERLKFFFTSFYAYILVHIKSCFKIKIFLIFESTY